MHDDVNEPPRRGKRGIVLPICLSLMFTLLVLALALAQQSRAHLGFALLVEAETREREAASAAMGDLQSIMQYVSDPVGSKSEVNPSVMGLPNPLPTPGAGVATFSNGPDIDVKIVGQFNGSAPDASIFEPVVKGYSVATADGYSAGATTVAGLFVPSRHAGVYVTAAVPNEPRATYLGMFSSLYPIGLMAVQGTVKIAEARSAGDYRGSESGIPVHIYGSQNVTVMGFCNGRMFSTSAQMTQSQTGGLKGALTMNRMPADFEAQLATAKAQVVQTLVDEGAAIQQLHQCLHENIPDNNDITTGCANGQCVAQFNPGNPDVSTLNGMPGTDLNGNTFQVIGDFVVPSGTGIQVPFDMDIQGNLVLSSQSVLNVTGKLAVHGNVMFQQQASLVCGSTVTVDGTVDMLYAPSPNISISSCILATADVNLAGGMSSHEEGVKLTARDPYSTPPCPFADSTLTCLVPGRPPQVHYEQVPNPNCDKFLKQSQQCVQMNNAAFAQFFPVVVAQGPVSTTQVAGIFVNTDGNITIGGSRAAGLFVATGTINSTSSRVVGCMWSRTGSINASSSNWRWFPYWSYAFVHTVGGDLFTGATRYWRVGFGRAQQ